jgi:hypothetical protein
VGCKSAGGVGPQLGSGLPLVVSAGWQGSLIFEGKQLEDVPAKPLVGIETNPGPATSWKVAERLAKFKATGCVCFPAVAKGGLLKVLRSPGMGSGLFAASDFQKNDVITYLPVDQSPDAIVTDGTEKCRVGFFVWVFNFFVYRV